MASQAMKQRRASRRLEPMGAEGLDAIRRILTERQAQKVNEVLVDTFSASAIVQVYDALNEKNRESLLKLPVGRVGAICWKLVNRG